MSINLSKISKVHDDIVEKTSGIVGWLVVFLTLNVAYEVIMRYVFKHPNIGAWDLSVMLQGSAVFLGSYYAVYRGQHAVVDFLLVKVSPKNRAILDFITGILAVFAVSILLWQTGENALYSIDIKQRLSSSWRPPIYPFKVAMTLGIGLALIEHIIVCIRKLAFVFSAGKD
jgi:TRAP-type mannitol/chloroaromatic compound transport system permease small subunit